MTWEGGMRVPGIAWWPGTIPAGRVSDVVASTMDLFSTALAVAGAAEPGDRVIDGVDLTPWLKGAASGQPRDFFPYYRGEKLTAARLGPWKAHFVTQWAYTPQSNREEHDPPRLYHLDHDPSEQLDVADRHPEVIARIRARVAEHEARLVRRPSQLDARLD